MYIFAVWKDWQLLIMRIEVFIKIETIKNRKVVYTVKTIKTDMKFKVTSK